MTPEQIRARLQEISALLENIKAENGVFSAVQVEEINTLNEEFEGLSAQLDASEKIEAMKAKASTSTRKTAPSAVSTPRVELVRDEKQRFGGFNSAGEFLMAVKGASQGQIAKQFQSVAYERNGEDGGFLVPEEIAQGILTKLSSTESLLSQTNQLKCSGNSLTINIDEAQPWNNGVQAYWMNEGGTFTPTKPVFKQASFKLQKLGALVVATDELLDDAVALESYIASAAPAAIMHKINGAIINGNGVGKPVGLLNSPFTIEVAAEDDQEADTIVARNIINMYSRMFPIARQGAAWYMNAQCEAQLLGLKDDNDNFIYLSPGSQLNSTPYGLLMGRPVYPMMSAMPALGDSGDIIFANLSYYSTLQKSAGGLKSAQSIHLYFDTEKTAFRFSMRIDGKVPFQSPVTTEYGSHTMSAFVKLEDR